MSRNSLQLEGSMVALVTPMHAGGSLDWKALDSLVDLHIEQDTSAIVAVGTTGESATLSVGEHLEVIERVAKRIDKRLPVIAGTGANSTSEAIELTKAASAEGADACLLVVPYYNKPTQEGLYQHFMTVADSVDVPQILYNVPSRTITDMQNETVLRLADHQNIIGIKDATGDIVRGQDLIEQSPLGFVVYSGDDITAADLMLKGARGNISVTANIVPEKMAKLCQLAMSGQAELAGALQSELMPLHSVLFSEANPIPVKCALSLMGLISNSIRLPLTPLSASAEASLRTVMASHAFLSC